MDDLQSKLAGILNDPESMERVRQMAENLFSSEEKESVDNETTTKPSSDMPSGDEIKMIMTLMSKFKGQSDDERTHLLSALKPYLSEKRQKKTDNAIKILKLLEILPLLKDSGLFKL